MEVMGYVYMNIKTIQINVQQQLILISDLLNISLFHELFNIIGYFLCFSCSIVDISNIIEDLSEMVILIVIISLNNKYLSKGKGKDRVDGEM